MQHRPDVAQARHEVACAPGQARTPNAWLFIDETGAAAVMACRYGRFALAQRLVIRSAASRGRHQSFVAAMRVALIAAPCVFDGPMIAPAFATAGQSGAPDPAPISSPELRSHKVAAFRAAIAAAGARLRYLPAYISDFNPIEQFFA